MTRLLVISLPLTITHSARFVNSAALDAARPVWYTEAMDKKLRPVISIRIFRETKCFGPGVAELLRHVREAHSLRGAAMTMGMAYSKAWRIVNEAEGQLGCKLIERDGARGSTLTPAGERAIAVYEELQADINQVIATKADALIASIKE